jgi:hypothetical protein
MDEEEEEDNDDNDHGILIMLFVHVSFLAFTCRDDDDANASSFVVHDRHSLLSKQLTYCFFDLEFPFLCLKLI